MALQRGSHRLRAPAHLSGRGFYCSLGPLVSSQLRKGPVGKGDYSTFPQLTSSEGAAGACVDVDVGAALELGELAGDDGGALAVHDVRQRGEQRAVDSAAAVANLGGLGDARRRLCCRLG